MHWRAPLSVFALCSNAQHSTAVCHDVAVLIKLRARVEYIVTVRVFEFLQTVNLEALFIFHRVAVRRRTTQTAALSSNSSSI